MNSKHGNQNCNVIFLKELKLHICYQDIAFNNPLKKNLYGKLNAQEAQRVHVS